MLVVDGKAEFADQVQDGPGGRTKARNISGVGRDLRLDQHDVEGHTQVT
jgi:hypothetical protein